MDFIGLGLTVNEAKAYEALLKLGKTTAANISKESKVPYGRIYTVLDSLESKGLIVIIPEETKKYAPSDPESLQTIITEKIQGLEEMRIKVKDFKKIYEEHAKEPVIIAQGKNNFHKISSLIKEREKYDYAIKYNFSTRPKYIEGYQRKKKIIDMKSLGRFDKETEEPLKVWKKIDPNIKPIPNEGIAMSIIDDEEMFIGLIKSNTTILIRDKSFAKLMKELFLRYYETQK